jgi:hypothetical protein
MGKGASNSHKQLIETFLQTYYSALSRQLEGFHRFYVDKEGQLTCDYVLRGVTLPWIPLRSGSLPEEALPGTRTPAAESPGDAAPAGWSRADVPHASVDGGSGSPAEFRISEFSFDPKQMPLETAVGLLQAAIQSALPAVYYDIRISSYDVDEITSPGHPGSVTSDVYVVAVGSIHVSEVPRPAWNAEPVPVSLLKYVALFPFIQTFRLRRKQVKAESDEKNAAFFNNNQDAIHVWICHDVLRYLDGNILNWLPPATHTSDGQSDSVPQFSRAGLDAEQERVIMPAAHQGPMYPFAPSPQPLSYAGNFQRTGMMPFFPYPFGTLPNAHVLASADVTRMMQGRYQMPGFIPPQPVYGMNPGAVPANIPMSSGVKAADDLPFACTIWVGGVPPGSTEDLIRAEFSRFGPIHKVDYRPMRGFAFIVFVSEKARDRAIEQYRSGNFVPTTRHFENAHLKIDYKREFGNRSMHPIYRVPYRMQPRIPQPGVAHQFEVVARGDYPAPQQVAAVETSQEIYPAPGESPVRAPTLPSR